MKACIIEPERKGEKYRYFDKEGNELHAGDIIQWESGEREKLYLTTNGRLGTDATNPAWIANGRACECQYGVYPLTWISVKEIVKITE